MVFENLTLFEIRLEDAQFGPRSLGREGGSDADPVAAEEGGRRRLAPAFILVLTAVSLAVLWRRSRGGDEVDLAIESDAEPAVAE